MKNLKSLVITLAAMVAFGQLSIAQTKLDESPADIALLRENGKGTPVVAKIIYGRPHKKGRTMLGEKEPFGKVWRLGANETTEIKLSKPVTFGEKQIPAGTYSLYAIPDKSEWTLIFNSKLDTWGAYEYEEGKDVARVKVPVSKSDAEVEDFTIGFDGKGGDGNMTFAWETTSVKVPLKY